VVGRITNFSPIAAGTIRSFRCQASTSSTSSLVASKKAATSSHTSRRIFPWCSLRLRASPSWSVSTRKYDPMIFKGGGFLPSVRSSASPLNFPPFNGIALGQYILISNATGSTNGLSPIPTTTRSLGLLALSIAPSLLRQRRPLVLRSVARHCAPGLAVSKDVVERSTAVGGLRLLARWRCPSKPSSPSQ